MGYASCLENNIEKVHDNQHMRGGHQAERRRQPVPVVESPPLQPVVANAVIPPPSRPDAETVALRARAMHEKHVLALYELRPGHRWRQ
jgi:hypothetical protein